jgi:hypothetical protein
VWDERDKVFRPLPRFHNLASAAYGDGEVVELAPIEDRSDKSHRHEFAWLREAWKNLPEAIADQYPTAEHLRKRALIDAGFYDEQVIDAGSNAAALRVGAAISARPGETFSLVIVRLGYVFIRTAKSQSRRAMDREEFARSKNALIEIVSDLIGVEPATLRAQSSTPGSRQPEKLAAGVGA